MVPEQRFRGTLRAIYAHWPLYAGLYGGIIIALLIIGVSAQRGWLSFIPLTLAVLMVLGYLLATRIFALFQLYDRNGLRPYDVLFDMGNIGDTDTFVLLDLGYRYGALSLLKRLTLGRIIAVDIYNPQWMPDGALVRWRERMPHAPSDPRLSWREGHFSLLPLPDRSVTAVLLSEVAGELWLKGDRLTLFQEIHRILTPNGRLLMAERTRSRANWATLDSLSLPSSAEWQQQLTAAGFAVKSEKSLQGFITCFRADKPTTYEAQQMALRLDYEA